MRYGPAALMLVLAGCVVPPEPPTKPVPVVQRTAPADWFQQQLAAVRAARAAHTPKSDTAGAQAEYDRILHAACTRVALSGPEKYRARCASVLKPAPAAPESDPFVCSPGSTDPVALQECND